ncbi:hypothetical protein BC629DRAFT_658043 [Irpex lacteus]|nr:hypothetical protein BC629DRAFT_658043 [Irpex lacteus]
MPTCEASFAYEYKNRRAFTSSSSPSRHTTRSLILYLPSHTFTMFPRGYFPQPPQSPYLAVPVLVPVFAAPVPVQAHATHTTNVYYNVQCDHHDCEQHRHNLGLADKAKSFLTGRSARPSAHEQHYLEAGPPRSPSRLSSRSGRPGSAVSSVVPSPSPSPSRSHFLHPPTPSHTQYPTATYRQPSPQPQPILPCHTHLLIPRICRFIGRQRAQTLVSMIEPLSLLAILFLRPPLGLGATIMDLNIQPSSAVEVVGESLCTSNRA